MLTNLMGAAAHGLGSLRIGRRGIPSQNRIVDGLGKFAWWIGGERAIATPWPGVRFETDLTDRIQRQMWANVYEPHVRECFSALLKPGDVYFDVGGHIGFHAVFAAHRVGADGRVFAFEAAPRNYERLAGNLAQFPWARAVNAAVWDHSGSLVFECSSTKSESGWGTVSEVRDFGTGEHVTVPCVALDDFIAETRLERWDAVKLDAEGSEFAVLRGAESSLEKFRPSLVTEFNAVLMERNGKSPLGLPDWLLERGYRIFGLEYRRLVPWNPTRSADFSDTLCLPEERVEQILKRLEHAGFEQAG